MNGGVHGCLFLAVGHDDDGRCSCLDNMRLSSVVSHRASVVVFQSQPQGCRAVQVFKSTGARPPIMA
jgi:hypothetical protein